LFKSAVKKAEEDSWKEFCESVTEFPEAARISETLSRDKVISIGKN